MAQKDAIDMTYVCQIYLRDFGAEFVLAGAIRVLKMARYSLSRKYRITTAAAPSMAQAMADPNALYFSTG